MRKNLLFIFIFFSTVFFAQQNLNVKVYRETEGTTNHIFIDNNEILPISIEYTYKAENSISTLADKSVLLIPGNSKKKLISTITPIDPKKGTKFNFDVFYVLGETDFSNYDYNFTYSLPFKKNKIYRIYQGYNGNFSHHKDLSLDFSLNEGEEIFASRDGIVAYVDVKNNKSCPTNECEPFANKIIIQHTDGSLAEYVHLKKNGAVVKVGDQVKIGELIGYSGNTGWSKGPHLHFSVYYNNIDGTRKYMKTKFLTAQNSKPILLEEKKSYSRK